MSAIDNIIEGASNSLGSGAINLGLGAIKGLIQKSQQEKSAKELANFQNELARKNALDKWSIEKSSMQKAGINMAALQNMQTTAIQQATPTPIINNESNIPDIASGANNLSAAGKQKTEEELNEEFLKQSGDYWAAQTKQRLADAQLKGAQDTWTKTQEATGSYELRVRQGVINAYGGTSQYARALNQMFWKRYESLDQSITESMSKVGLNQWNTQLALQKTIESQEFIKLGWYQASTNRMYQMGMLKLGQDRLEFDKNAFKSNLWFEIEKFNRSINLDWQKFNWQKGIDKVQMEYTKTLIKNLDQERYWKPVTVLSQAFRDVSIGMGAWKGNNRDNASKFKDFGIGAGAILGAAGGLAGTLGKLALMIK